MPSRVVYQDWIVDLAGFTPNGEEGSHEWYISCLKSTHSSSYAWQDDRRSELIAKAVRKALAELTTEEQDILECHYFMGENYQDIAAMSGRKAARIEAISNRALKKLKKKLTQFAEKKFSVPAQVFPNCPLCQSLRRREIDILILQKPRRATWKKVISDLRTNFGIVIVAPQTLIGHEKYHG